MGPVLDLALVELHKGLGVKICGCTLLSLGKTAAQGRAVSSGFFTKFSLNTPTLRNY